MTTVFQQIGPYRILRQIGHGGMAVVFLALDTRFDRQVALKLVQHGSDREALEIVEAEKFGAELQKQFSERGAHVPAVYEYGVDEDCGYFYVAMEYLDGENLSEVVARGALSTERAVDVAIELARFLDDAHAFEAVINGRNLQSLLHLDLKPRNVRITSRGQVKVLDFGTAKALSLSRKVTRNDFGSVAYLSPERLETGEVDARADLWALGVVLYEMLRGSPPFQAADTRRLERLILSRRPPASIVEHCPIGLAAVVAKLLDPVPAERYATARDIRTDLERFRAGERTVAEGQGWPARAYDDDATRRTSPIPSDPGPAQLGTSDGGDEDAERTRRTQPPPLPRVVPPPLPLVGTPVSTTGNDKQKKTPAAAELPSRKGRPERPPRTKSQRFFRTAMLLIGLGLAVNEISIASRAGRLANAASTLGVDALPAAWGEYDTLVDKSHFHVATHDLRNALTERTLELVERVTANYLTATATVREAQWMMARDVLTRALTSAGDDNELRSRLRLCEGHLLRIDGEAKKARGDVEGSSNDLTEAVVAFRQAHELSRNWPDPLVGLARTFIVGLEDVERGAQALDQAQALQYEISERDRAQLADGYRALGNSLVRTARQLDGLPLERDYLSRAAEAYRLALVQYANAGNFSGVPQSVARTQRALLQVEEDLGGTAPAEESAEAPPADVPSIDTPLQGALVQSAAP
jgi:serine/threonine protein kinase